MNQTERIEFLEQQNYQLKKDNEMLNNIITQMRITLNRLIDRYIMDDYDEELA